jgi:hypothetical protein
MKTLDHMLRVLYETAWHSRMLMCYHGQRFHPIFHPLSIWDDMERQLRHLQNQPLTLSEMGPALIRIWNKIPKQNLCFVYRILLNNAFFIKQLDE